MEHAFVVAVQVLDSTVRLSIPLMVACLAGLYSERAGVFDIGLEGKMLAAAFAGAASVGAAAPATAVANEARTETLSRLLAERFILSPGVFGLALHMRRAPERLVNPGAPSSGDASTPRCRMRPIRK